jgi:predicted glycosyltransferase
MRIAVDIYHPAQVHYFKNFMWELAKRGNEFLIIANDKDITYKLLDVYGFKYKKLGTYGRSLIDNSLNLPLLDARAFDAIRKFKPDILIGHSPIRAAHASKVLRKPCIGLDDTEHAKFGGMLYIPFTDAILTPSCFNRDLGRKHIRFNGYIETTYTHPNYFKPDEDNIRDIGLNKNDPYILLRLVSWNAHHDVGQKGIDEKISLIRELEKYGRVLISSEGGLNGELKKYEIKLSPEKIHDILYYASLYIGEGATMATEAGLLGTPSVYISSLAGTMGNFVELEKYGLVYSFREQEKALAKAIEILQDKHSKSEWRARKDRLFKEKIDVTQFLIWFVENYPRSFDEMQKNPAVQAGFM